MMSYFHTCDVAVANLNHKSVLYFFDVHFHQQLLFPPHFEKDSAAHAMWALCKINSTQLDYLLWLFSG